MEAPKQRPEQATEPEIASVREKDLAIAVEIHTLAHMIHVRLTGAGGWEPSAGPPFRFVPPCATEPTGEAPTWFGPSAWPW